MNRSNTILVLEKAVTVLSCFEERGDWSLTEIRDRLGWHVATVHRILATLESTEYLRQDAQSKRYRLGPKLLRLVRRATDDLNLAKVAQPLMDELTLLCGETVYLAALDGYEVVYLAVAQPDRPVKSTANVGERRPCHSTGTGKVLLANGSERIVAHLLERELAGLTEFTMTEPASFRQELQTIQSQGYAVCSQEHSLDVASVAVPIYGPEGIVAAVAISGPAFRLPIQALHKLVEPLWVVAQRITSSVGGSR